MSLRATLRVSRELTERDARLRLILPDLEHAPSAVFEDAVRRAREWRDPSHEPRCACEACRAARIHARRNAKLRALPGGHTNAFAFDIEEVDWDVL